MDRAGSTASSKISTRSSNSFTWVQSSNTLVMLTRRGSLLTHLFPSLTSWRPRTSTKSSTRARKLTSNRPDLSKRSSAPSLFYLQKLMRTRMESWPTCSSSRPSSYCRRMTSAIMTSESSWPLLTKTRMATSLGLISSLSASLLSRHSSLETKCLLSKLHRAKRSTRTL